MQQNVHLIPLEKNNPDHIAIMYKVRTHPEVDQYLTGDPPINFLEHVKYLHSLKEAKRVYIIACSDALCGFCQTTLSENYVEVGWAIHPDWWEKGIGTAAIAELLAIVKSDPVLSQMKITLFVKVDNHRAIHLYEKFGFHVSGEIAEKNELIMEKKQNGSQ